MQRRSRQHSVKPPLQQERSFPLQLRLDLMQTRSQEVLGKAPLMHARSHLHLVTLAVLQGQPPLTSGRSHLCQIASPLQPVRASQHQSR
jgi:hypothetical protein